MASTTQFRFLPSSFSFSSLTTLPSTQTTQTTLFFPHQSRTSVKTYSTGVDIGDFGARDPFPAEIESNFGDKVLGFKDTEHKILIPTAAALSLAQQQCIPIGHLHPPMSETDAKKLLFKVVGWKIVNVDGILRLQCMWRLRDFKSSAELINRISKVLEPTNHFPDIHIEQNNQVRAELCTTSIRGLSINDFIVAAKIDTIKTSDLAPKKRAWA